jgi:hypothetical protein
MYENSLFNDNFSNKESFNNKILLIIYLYIYWTLFSIIYQLNGGLKSVRDSRCECLFSNLINHCYCKVLIEVLWSFDY